MGKKQTDEWVARSKELRKSIKALGDKGLAPEEIRLRLIEIKANFVLFEAALERMVSDA